MEPELHSESSTQRKKKISLIHPMVLDQLQSVMVSTSAHAPPLSGLCVILRNNKQTNSDQTHQIEQEQLWCD